MKTAADYSLDEARESALERKRANFIQDYELVVKPVLLWQCMPTDDVVVDVRDDALVEAMRVGASAISDNGWWYAFKSGRRPALVFEGLASSTAADAAGWATELHLDGHFQAGLWTFPELSANAQAQGSAVADFYTEAFRDFGFVATKVYESTGHSGGALVTCTMLHSDKLPLVGGRDRIVAPAVRRNQLRWPLLTVASPKDFAAALTTMAAQFLRAYGRSLPKQ